MQATFDNTVGVLVKAYLDGTLLKGNCCACAVGNLCAASLGFKVTDVVRNAVSATLNYHEAEWGGVDSSQSGEWRRVFMTMPTKGQRQNPENYRTGAKTEIDATGYTWQQLARIEYAFETALPGYTEEAEFAGLMAVVTVLADIHAIDTAAAEAAKCLFVKA